MGDGCDIPNIAAGIQAKRQIQGDIFSEAERLKEFDGPQMFHYERIIANNFGLDSKSSNKESAWDALKKFEKKAENPLLRAFDGKLYGNPSQIHSKRFFGSIDRKMKAFYKGGKTDRATYNEQIAKPIKTIIEGINNVITNANTRKELNNGLVKYGLNDKDVYHAKKYLDWLADGGPLQKSKHDSINILNQVGSNLAKAQANAQLLWTAGNGVDMVRPYSHYLTREPASLGKILKGTSDALAATKGMPWRIIPELEKEGIYRSSYVDRQHKNNTPFQMSVTAQKNITYFLAKAFGEDPHSAIRDLLFDYSPWDRPNWDRSPDTKLLLDLARYPVNEARWLFSTSKKALTGNKKEMVNLFTYGLAKAFFVGSVSMIPTPLWVAMSKDQHEEKKAFDEEHHLNAVKGVSAEMFKAMGLPGLELDMSDYTRVGGGAFGSRLNMVKDTFGTIFGSTFRAGDDLLKGNVSAAALRSGEAGLALSNLGGWAGVAEKYGKYGKALEPVTKFEGSSLNATEFTKLFQSMAKNMEGEFTTEDAFKKDVAKDFLGSAVKKAD